MRMTDVIKKALVLVLVVSMLVVVAAGCGGPKDQDATGNADSSATDSKGGQDSSDSGDDVEPTKIDTSKHVNLVMYLWGGPSPDHEHVMGELNKRLKEKINATLEMKYVPWDAIQTKYPLIFASGEAYDMIYTGSSANPSYFSLCEKNAFKALDELLPVYAPETWKKTSPDMWEDTKYNGKIYAIPARYTEYIPHGFVYRGDLIKKYGMEPIASIENMEKYMDNVLANEKGMVPWNANGNNAIDLYKMFVDLTGTWIPAPGLSFGTMHLVAESKDDIKNIFHPAFTDEFMDFVARVKGWSDKGYWPKDVLSSKEDPVNQFNAGKGAAFFQHAQGYVGWYGGLVQAQPESDPLFFCFGDVTKKIIKTRTMQNATGFSANSKNTERALMLVDLIMNDKETYELFHFGIKGRNYELDENGKRISPENFDGSKHGYGQAGWALRTDEFEIQVATDYPGRAEMNSYYDTFSIKDPYSNFSFTTKPVDSEIAAVNQVNSQYGVPILFGKAGDPQAAVETYRQKLKAAGIEKIIAELQKQLENYQPVK